MLSTEGRIYYFSCVYLWSAVSVFNYLTDDLHAPDIAQASTTWARAHGHLGNWLSEERFFPIDLENPTNADIEQLYGIDEASSDALISQWGGELWSSARVLHKMNANLSETMALYYCYCSWLSKTLTEFQSILDSPAMGQTVFHTHYRERLAALQGLATLLNGERPATENAVNCEVSLESSSVLEMRVGELAVSWREAVYSAAGNAGK